MVRISKWEPAALSTPDFEVFFVLSSLVSLATLVVLSEKEKVNIIGKVINIVSYIEILML